MKNNWGRRAIALVVGLVFAATVGTPARAATPSALEIMRGHAASSAVHSQALAATAKSGLDWIEKELAASNHRFQTTFGDQKFDDIGLTIDGLLALAAGGRGGDAEAKNASDYVVAHAADYATDGGDGRFAGALGKLLLVAEIRGISTTMGALNVETDLRSRMQTTGNSAGRFSDKGTAFGNDPSNDFSNGFGDAIDVIALSGTTAGVPAAALTWLRKQQCANGGFRSNFGNAVLETEGAATNTSCAANSETDLDATTFALLALAASGDESDATVNAFLDGLDYLVSQQADNGSFANGNGNSTGLAASLLRGVGDAPDANLAAKYVIDNLQLSSGADAGAIALTKAGADTAKTSGLTAPTREVFERATPQAVLALGLPDYTDIGVLAPVEPSTAATLSSSSVAIGAPVTASGQGFLAGEDVDFVLHSDPINVGTVKATSASIASLTFNAPAAAGAGVHTLTLTGKVSGATVSVPLTLTAAATTSTTSGSAATTSTTARILPRTGDDHGNQSLFATGLVLVGGALVIAARKRRIIYPFKR